MALWTEHKAPDGRSYYYDRSSGTSRWTRPDGFRTARHVRPTLQGCLDESPAVAGLYNAILRYCGVAGLPTITSRSGTGDPLCEGGRGGAFCCASQRIYMCSHGWVGCREVAYELSHALNVCRGKVRCSREGMRIDGEDCGYLAPPDVACSELRASYWTGRCSQQGNADAKRRCTEWHARWAVASCFPDDAYLVSTCQQQPASPIPSIVVSARLDSACSRKFIAP